MTRAWAIFRQTYSAKSMALIAALSTEAKARIEGLTDAIAFEGFNDRWLSTRANIAAMRAEGAQLP
jgi:hypothetical protein